MFLFFSNKKSKSDDNYFKWRWQNCLQKDEKKKKYAKPSALIFANIVSDLKISNILKDVSDIRTNYDSAFTAFNKFQNQPSLDNIKQREFNAIFSFNNINEYEVLWIIKKLNVRKTR